MSQTYIWGGALALRSCFLRKIEWFLGFLEQIHLAS